VQCFWVCIFPNELSANRNFNLVFKKERLTQPPKLIPLVSSKREGRLACLKNKAFFSSRRAGRGKNGVKLSQYLIILTH
jgi:hypothetical protein